MKVYVGYDTREDIAYQVCKHSIITKNKDYSRDGIEVTSNIEDAID